MRPYVSTYNITINIHQQRRDAHRSSESSAPGLPQPHCLMLQRWLALRGDAAHPPRTQPAGACLARAFQELPPAEGGLAGVPRRVI